MSGAGPNASRGEFGDDRFPLQAILLFRAGGGWHLSTVLCREGDSEPFYVGGWSEPWSDRGIADDWRYLEERIRDERYGNGHTFELQAFAARTVGDVETIALALALAAEAVAASGGPLGEPVGTVEASDATRTVWMPFVVVAEAGRVLLVSTDETPEKPVFVMGPDGPVDWETLDSVEHWQRNGERAWPLAPGGEHHVAWVDGEVYLAVSGDGGVLHLDDRPAPTRAITDGEAAQDSPLVRVAWSPTHRSEAVERLTVHVTSESERWGWAIPMVLRTAAGPAYGNTWPAAPDDADCEGVHGYWAALHHLLLYSFGWRRPDRGLRWWYGAGHPVADRRLRLIATTYLADGQLGWYHAWLCRSHANLISYEIQANGFELPEQDRVDRAWLDAQFAAAEASGLVNPLTGGGDPLHLSYHANGPVQPVDAPVELRRSGRGSRSGILLCDSALGWYRALQEEANELPSIHDPRWRIDVVIMPIGWIGTFRRSPQTDRWYVGDHRLHLRGS